MKLLLSFMTLLRQRFERGSVRQQSYLHRPLQLLRSCWLDHEARSKGDARLPGTGPRRNPSPGGSPCPPRPRHLRWGRRRRGAPPAGPSPARSPGAPSTCWRTSSWRAAWGRRRAGGSAALCPPRPRPPPLYAPAGTDGNTIRGHPSPGDESRGQADAHGPRSPQQPGRDGTAQHGEPSRRLTPQGGGAGGSPGRRGRRQPCLSRCRAAAPTRPGAAPGGSFALPSHLLTPRPLRSRAGPSGTAGPASASTAAPRHGTARLRAPGATGSRVWGQHRRELQEPSFGTAELCRDSEKCFGVEINLSQFKWTEGNCWISNLTAELKEVCLPNLPAKFRISNFSFIVTFILWRATVTCHCHLPSHLLLNPFIFQNFSSISLESVTLQHVALNSASELGALC